MFRRKKYPKKIKRYFSSVLVLVIVILGLILIHEKTAQEPEISYPEVVEQEAVKIETQQQYVQVQPVQEQKFTAPLVKETGETVDGLTATFSDSFSSMAWLDGEKTTLYFDWTGTNLLFPPVIETNEILDSGILDNFVQKKVAFHDKKILFLGHDLLTAQKQILLWQSTFDDLGARQDKWLKSDFNKLGFDEDEEIIQVRALAVADPGIGEVWAVFSKQVENIKVSILNNELLVINTADLMAASLSEVECRDEKCLMYNSVSSKFWELDIQTLQVQPVKELSEKAAKKAPEQVVISKSGLAQEWIIGLANEQAFEIWKYKSESGSLISVVFSQTTKYPGTLAILPMFDGRTFVLWASYFTRAYEIDNDGRITDLSSRFGWRISKNGEIQLYRFKDSIYINNKSTIVRFSGEINTRIDHFFWLAYSPNFMEIAPSALSLRATERSEAISTTNSSENSGYLIAGVPGNGTKIYQFADKGFDLTAIRQAVSQKVNFSAANINAAQISGLEAGMGQARIQYFLCNDGGKTWREADLGQVVKFENPGNDLRWKIKIIPYKQANPFQTPYLRSINLTYWYNK